MDLFRKMKINTRTPDIEEERLLLEMQTIGRKIASLRKAGDWTQAGLADQLGVTYQAVSNWERGLSMPDVARLKDLAVLFHITLDELLGSEEATRVVEVASGNRPAESVRELLDSAPYMKPSALEQELKARKGKAGDDTLSHRIDPAIDPDLKRPVDQAWTEEGDGSSPASTKGHVEESTARNFSVTSIEDHSEKVLEDGSSEGSSDSMTFQDILAFAPFISSELLHELILSTMDSQMDFELKHLTMVAPFLDQPQLKELTERCLKGSFEVSVEVITGLLPHLDQETLQDLEENLSDSKIDHPGLLVKLAPFLDTGSMGRITLRMDDMEALPDKIIVSLAPFLQSRDLTLLIQRRGASARTLRKLLMPFLDDSNMDDFVRSYLDQKKQ